MRPTVKRRWGARAAIIQQKRRRNSKLGITWATRKHGTPKQVGKKFPVKSGSKYGLERAGLWLTKSAKIVGMGAGRAERYLEKVAEKLGRIAAAPQRLKAAYERGYMGETKKDATEKWKESIAKRVLGVEPADVKEANLRKEIARKYYKLEGRLVSSDLGKRLENFIAKLRRQLNTYGLTQAQRAQIAEKLSRAERLANELAAIDEAAPMSSGVELARLNMRRNELKRELFAIGGKFWISKAIKRPGALRRAVQRIYGKAGFDSKGRIKMSVLRELAKEKNPLGARARLSIKLRKFCVGGGKTQYPRSRKEIENRQRSYGGMHLAPRQFTSDASDAIRIPKFEVKSKWSSRARK